MCIRDRLWKDLKYQKKSSFGLEYDIGEIIDKVDDLAYKEESK